MKNRVGWVGRKRTFKKGKLKVDAGLDSLLKFTSVIPLFIPLLTLTGCEGGLLWLLTIRKKAGWLSSP
jgi:hypothetical protein